MLRCTIQRDTVFSKVLHLVVHIIYLTFRSRRNTGCKTRVLSTHCKPGDQDSQVINTMLGHNGDDGFTLVTRKYRKDKEASEATIKKNDISNNKNVTDVRRNKILVRIPPKLGRIKLKPLSTVKERHLTCLALSRLSHLSPSFFILHFLLIFY